MDQDNRKEKRANKRTIIVFCIIILILLILFLLFGLRSCTNTVSDNSPSDTPNQQSEESLGESKLDSTETTPPQTPAGAIKEFYDASIKHGLVNFSSDIGEPLKVEYWFDDIKYRLTWYKPDGSPRHHMICPDGDLTYYAYVDEEITKIGYILPEFHHWIFNGPPNWEIGEGEQEGELNVFTYTAKKLWHVEESSQDFYLEDLMVYSNEDQVVKVVTRTKSEKPESEDELFTSTYTFEKPEYNIELPRDVFKIPYPIVEE